MTRAPRCWRLPQSARGLIPAGGTERSRAQVSRLRSMPRGSTRWDFLPTRQAGRPKFHYLYLRFGSNKALLPPLDICHPAGEQSCCHSTSADLKWCSEKIKATLGGGCAAPAVMQSFVSSTRKDTVFIFYPSAGSAGPPLFHNSHFHFLLSVLAPKTPPAFSTSQGKKTANRRVRTAVKAVCEWHFYHAGKKGREGLQLNDTQHSHKKSFS